MATSTTRAAGPTPFLDYFPVLAQPEPAWLAELRAVARSRYAELGIPTSSDEDWRFTPVGDIATTGFTASTDSSAPLAEGVTRSAGELVGPSAASLVFVNGHFAPALSTRGVVPGVSVMTFAEALAERSDDLRNALGRAAKFDNASFTALNAAAFSNGAVVFVGASVEVKEPIHIVNVGGGELQPQAAHTRALVILAKGASATVVETFVSANAEDVHLTNAVSEYVLGEGASVDHYRVQLENFEAYHIGTTGIVVGRDANFRSHNVTFGGFLTRNDFTSLLDGDGGECTLNGVYIANGKRLVANHTTIDHARPHCNSHEVYKGILDDRGRGVFNGKIFVRIDAQKTDAKQTNQTLLLSDDAQLNTKPQLEIFADDVKCTHGATVGQLSADALFYLRARGIAEPEARTILVQAFIGDVLDRIRVEPLRAALGAKVPELLAFKTGCEIPLDGGPPQCR